MNNKIWIIFCTLLTCIGISYAAVPPEIPQSRTTQIFSPFYFDLGTRGENTMLDGGPFLLGYEYNEDSIHIQRVVPTGSQPLVNLETFIYLLNTPAGITLLASHGSNNTIAVESYPGGNAGKTKVENAIATYYALHPEWPEDLLTACTGADDCFTNPEKAEYWTIAVTPDFINGIMGKIQTHSFIFHSGCYSAEFWDHFNNLDFNRVLTYFNGEIYSTSILRWKSDGQKAAETLFGLMSGVESLNGVYLNYPISAAIIQAKQQVPQAALKLNNNPPSASNLRLFNAPRIVKAEITQDGKTVYRYDTGNYPYVPENPDYPGGITPEKALGTPGKFQVKLVFSEPMQNDYADFKVKFVSQGMPDVELSDGKWGSDELLNDTWIGTAEIEESAQPSKEITLSVNALRNSIAPGLDTRNQRLDTDGDGYSNITPDTWHKFEFLSMPPHVKSVKLQQGGKTVYQAAWNDISGTARALAVTQPALPIENATPLYLEIVFDKKMVAASAGFEKTKSLVEVKYGSFDTTKTKWTGYVAAGEVQNILEGTQSLLITGVDASGRALDTKPATIPYYDAAQQKILGYEDTEGVDGGQRGGTDKNHILKFKGEAPVVSVIADKPLWPNARGITTGINSGAATQGVNISVDDTAYGVGIATVTITGPQNFSWPFSPARKTLFAQNLGVLDSGYYTLSAFDALGNETRVVFGIGVTATGALSIVLNSSTLNGTANANGVTNAKFGVNITAPFGLKSVTLKKIASPADQILQAIQKNGETAYSSPLFEVAEAGLYGVEAKDLSGNVKELRISISKVSGIASHACLTQLECQSGLYDMWKIMLYGSETPGDIPSNVGVMPGAVVSYTNGVNDPAMIWHYELSNTPFHEAGTHTMGHLTASIESSDSEGGSGGGGSFPDITYYETAGANACPANAVYASYGCGQGASGCITPWYSRCAVGESSTNLPLSRYARLTHTAVQLPGDALPMGMCPGSCYNTKISLEYLRFHLV